MDQLRLCMNVLRLVARQPVDANRQLLLQRQIDGYLVREVADPKASLERLANAIDEFHPFVRPIWGTGRTPRERARAPLARYRRPDEGSPLRSFRQKPVGPQGRAQCQDATFQQEKIDRSARRRT